MLDAIWDKEEVILGSFESIALLVAAKDKALLEQIHGWKDIRLRARSQLKPTLLGKSIQGAPAIAIRSVPAIA